MKNSAWAQLKGHRPGIDTPRFGRTALEGLQAVSACQSILRFPVSPLPRFCPYGV